MRQVFLNGTDVSRFVSDIPEVQPTLGEYGQVVINEISMIKGFEIWDTFNPENPLFGANPADFTVQIFTDGVMTFEGNIKTVKYDYMTGTEVILRSALHAALEHGAIYVSDAPETPSEAIKNLCILYKIPFDSGSFANSNAIFTQDLVYIEVHRQLPEGSVLDLIQQIAEIGCMRVYSHNQLVYCDVFQVPTLPSIYTFSDSMTNPDGVTLFSHPNTETIEKEPVTGYSVQTTVGLAAYGDNTKQGKSISGGFDSPIRILSLQAGVFLGELWVQYLNRKQTKLSFDTKASLGKVLSLGSPVTIQYTIGNWPDTVIDLVEINQVDRLKAHLVGVTR